MTDTGLPIVATLLIDATLDRRCDMWAIPLALDTAFKRGENVSKETLCSNRLTA